MKRVPHILHLVDDTTAGGVMRVLDFLRSDSELAKTAHHDVKPVRRGKIIGNLGQPDVIVSHLAVSWRSLPSLIALRVMHARKSLVHVEHSYTESFMSHNVPNKWRFKTLLRLAFSCFDRVVCVSHGQSDWMGTSRLVQAANMVTIQSCVDLSAFRALPEPTGRARVFGAIGRLDDQKGFDTLITAFRKCDDPNIELHIVGEGTQEKALKTLAGQDQRIVFKGFQSDPALALADVDVVVMPSRWEAYGLVAIETLAAGRKLLCHNIDGLSDHAQLGGVMIDASRVEELPKLIAQAANSSGSDGAKSAIRHTRQLENQFRESWRLMLQGLGV